MQLRKMKRAVHKGFTLVELIIVIVILGILAAVAIPNLTSTSQSAYDAKEQAVVGALKSAWAIAYANKKASPTVSDIVAQMTDPSCVVVGTTNITCTGITMDNGSSTLATFSVGSSVTVASPVTISVSTS